MQKTDAKKIPKWGLFALVLITTFVVFWLLGGQHYVQNYSEVNQSIFHQEEDAASPEVWFFYLLQTGLLAGFVALLLSLLAVTVLNRREK
ncbi:MAG: hypothetical protein C0464_04275 [Cyanobacteria bacterium DS2.008]|nr:hypothetical protein [Cyanobacteria bacterium DS2.008]